MTKKRENVIKGGGFLKKVHSIIKGTQKYFNNNLVNSTYLNDNLYVHSQNLWLHPKSHFEEAKNFLELRIAVQPSQNEPQHHYCGVTRR